MHFITLTLTISSNHTARGRLSTQNFRSFSVKPGLSGGGRKARERRTKEKGPYQLLLLLASLSSGLF